MSLADPTGSGALPHTSIAHLDGGASTQNFEVDFHRRLPLGIETRVSMFRARSDAELLVSGDTAITQFTRPMLRQGVQANARYEPAAWLAMDFHGAAVRSRYADGAAEYVAGAAARTASAAATLRMPGGFSASLATNYLLKREGIDETLSPASSTFVNARLAHRLSKDTMVSLDFFNVSGQKLHPADYFQASRLGSPSRDALFNPAEPRGLRLWLKTTF